MKQDFTVRPSMSPSESKHLTTSQLRENYLIESIFRKDEITCTYTFHDRYIVGGAMPVSKPLALEAPDILKASYFLERRELGIINVGEAGTVSVDGKEYLLNNREALYVRDRKSTRLNSSHSQISYAVFCLKKKKNQS